MVLECVVTGLPAKYPPHPQPHSHELNGQLPVSCMQYMSQVTCGSLMNFHEKLCNSQRNNILGEYVELPLPNPIKPVSLVMTAMAGAFQVPHNCSMAAL